MAESGAWNVSAGRAMLIGSHPTYKGELKLWEWLDSLREGVESDENGMSGNTEPEVEGGLRKQERPEGLPMHKVLALADGMQSGLQRDPSQDLPALVIYLKNMTALKGQEGIYGLGIGVLWSWKES